MGGDETKSRWVQPRLKSAYRTQAGLARRGCKCRMTPGARRSPGLSAPQLARYFGSPTEGRDATRARPASREETL